MIPAVTINGEDASVSGDGTNWSAMRTMMDYDEEGPISFLIDYKDPAGNQGLELSMLPDSAGIVFDKTAPLLENIAIFTNNQLGYPYATAGDSINLIFSSNEFIYSPEVFLNEVELEAELKDSNWVASLLVTEGDSEGPVGFTVDYKDKSGNAGSQIVSSSDGSLVTIDQTGAQVTSVNAYSDRVLISGDSLLVSVQFSEPVIVSGQPEIILNIGGQSRSIHFIGGSENELDFMYHVADGDSVNGLDYQGSSSISVSDGYILDRALNFPTYLFLEP